MAYQHYRQAFSGPRWEYLTSRHATPQRVLFASTSTKNPDYPDTIYIEQLIGPDTVNTMPEETIEQYHDHGQPEPRLEHHLAQARTLIDRLARAGVDYHDITETLDREGVEKFASAFEELLDALEHKARALTAA